MFCFVIKARFHWRSQATQITNEQESITIYNLMKTKRPTRTYWTERLSCHAKEITEYISALRRLLLWLEGHAIHQRCRNYVAFSNRPRTWGHVAFRDYRLSNLSASSRSRPGSRSQSRAVRPSSAIARLCRRCPHGTDFRARVRPTTTRTRYRRRSQSDNSGIGWCARC